jgi:hypothetical protein
MGTAIRNYIMPKDKIPCDSLNRVIIRIWTSEYNKNYRGEGVGHVSIETRKHITSQNVNNG